jgi:hypothetical protein
MPLGNAVNATPTGLQSFTSTGVFNGRTLTGTANQVSVLNGNGVSGNPTVSLTSTIYVTGVSFNSGSNTLSNYVTGTFTPTITGSISNPTVGYAFQVGNYTRIGNRLFSTSKVSLNSVSGGSGDLQLSLPFTSVNAAILYINYLLFENISTITPYTIYSRSNGNLNFNTFIAIYNTVGFLNSAVISIAMLSATTLINATIHTEV